MKEGGSGVGFDVVVLCVEDFVNDGYYVLLFVEECGVCLWDVDEVGVVVVVEFVFWCEVVWGEYVLLGVVCWVVWG